MPAASARDYAGFARNVIPSGQYGAVPPPPGADRQAKMYDGLTPLFAHVTGADLFKYFKSEALFVNGPGPHSSEAVPHPGVELVRDGFDVPHIRAKTRDGATFAAGWVVAEDRALVFQVARGDSYLAAIDAPNLKAFDLVKAVRTFTPTAQTYAFVDRQTSVLRNAGPKGRQLLHDIDVYLQGVNARLKFDGSGQPPLKRRDIYASNALLAQFLGQGGGDEARRSELLSGLVRKFGRKRGNQVFDDLRERNDPEAPHSIDGRFPYGLSSGRSGNVVLDDDSLTTETAAARAQASDRLASNILMVSPRRSKTGHPLFVGGPQIGYFYPGLTLEMDVHAPNDNWRGATAPPFPGYVLIGRGEDWANTLTSAHQDIIDQFAETLCGGDRFHYLYKGRCLKMGTFDAGRLSAGDGEPEREVVFRTTVHGPVVGYATSHGRPVAIANARSSRGRETLFQLAFQDLSAGRVGGPKSFYKAFSQSPLTFNAFYDDSRHIAEYTAGRLPLRAKGVDPSLPTEGTGKHEWRGFLAAGKHPHGADPKRGVLENWNNPVARGLRPADDTFTYGPGHRDGLLKLGLARHRKHDLASVVGVMNAAATQDVREVLVVPTLTAVLSKGAPSARDAEMVKVLKAWRASGGSRLDRDLDGKIDHPGAAILDAAWSGLADAVMEPRLGPKLTEQLASIFKRYDDPVDQQTDGWHGYMDKDLRTLLGRPVNGRFHLSYCGRGSLARCRKALWAALDAAGDELQAAQGPNPHAWRADATAERKDFAPINLLNIRYANRPSGIQQVISFTGHR
ncbi:MAG: penicillin acylase family protein [Thermoleophilaceae bacterium]